MSTHAVNPQTDLTIGGNHTSPPLRINEASSLSNPMNSLMFFDVFSSAFTVLSSLSSALEKSATEAVRMHHAMLDHTFLVKYSGNTSTMLVIIVPVSGFVCCMMFEPEKHLVTMGGSLLELLQPLDQRGTFYGLLRSHLDRAANPHEEQLLISGHLPVEVLHELGHCPVLSPRRPLLRQWWQPLVPWLALKQGACFSTVET
ncbi:uncharacterized protein LOC119298328 [Triticum dicoccoides]|uniref:uncharacterized protein LOC119298328 n=1 Tax=Triticum dicoccoides TaxID=85692 RepID=UPI0018905522|nr:uncharacterized protein LOC119298328 [Triticum dicoccoides]